MTQERQGTRATWSYVLIRLLFKFVLKIFYGTIVVENANLIPENGHPCIICPNHSNSLTDALMLVTSVPSKKRHMLRLTAKSTLFGKPTFTSWLIESAGTVPIQRRKDYGNVTVDNSETMNKLMEALELGDAVCLFPEGISRYYPTLAPLKTGVARLVSDVLTRNQASSDFEISVVPCSITYMHRQHFRSDVLVTFHPPLTFSPTGNPELLGAPDHAYIRSITDQIQERISKGTFDSPSWDLVRIGKIAASIYAPLGTRMSLGNYVRIARTFAESFQETDDETEASEVYKLREDLKNYQDKLAQFGIKDDRIRRPLPIPTIIIRMCLRLAWSLFLFGISAPGLVLWVPVFGTTYYYAQKLKKTGPVHDTWDEIAHYKLIYGLGSGVFIWLVAVSATIRYAYITSVLIPAMMWMTLRWFEDLVSAVRAFLSLFKLLRAGQTTRKHLYEERINLHERLMRHATSNLGLPDNPEKYFSEIGGPEKGRVHTRWDSGAKYFSLRRRRKRDWNETLRLYDKVDYPALD
ncbi:hypothetical protein AX16_005195 [Volvariella volvacea WC 439]|nr:hypothetical protein AX16_005195 [Volvariella volvacea WC 439]